MTQTEPRPWLVVARNAIPVLGAFLSTPVVQILLAAILSYAEIFRLRSAPEPEEPQP